MHVHTVFFWLWQTASDEDRETFERGLDILTSDPRIVEKNVGTPARTDRPVIDSSYDYGLVLKFQTKADHDAYQAGEAHEAFLALCQPLWSRVQVYDIKTP